MNLDSEMVPLSSSIGSPKSDHERLAQQVCHPERSEGSRGQILRCAQNDTSERLRRKVYQRRAFRFRRTLGAVAAAIVLLTSKALGQETTNSSPTTSEEVADH